MVIFDCNGVLVDSEPIANAVLAGAFVRIGFPMNVDMLARRFHGRRQADMLSMVEAAAGKKLPPGFASTITAETLRRFRTELRTIPHVVHALSWLRGPKAVASSSSLDRIHLSLDVTDLLRFFQPRLFTATEVPKGKPAPDLFLLAAARMQVEPSTCIVVEDSAPGITAAVKAGMSAIGFVGGSQAPGRLAKDLIAAGARTVIADMRALKSTIIELRGW
jgi:HAD superfamily hydrolase (TIGR01509 family)